MSGPRFSNAVRAANVTVHRPASSASYLERRMVTAIIRKEEGGGAARFEIVLDEARVVRQVFQWVAQERATIGDVVRRLTAARERTRRGRTVWDQRPCGTF